MYTRGNCFSSVPVDLCARSRANASTHSGHHEWFDEITYRTPDALFNGNAVTNVIKSCVPAIRDPWAIPAMDVDSILVAIRIASYGHNMEMSTTCPHCENEADYGLDLRTILEQIKTPDYSKPVVAGDLQIFFKPMTYKHLNDNNQKQFEEQKLLARSASIHSSSM